MFFGVWLLLVGFPPPGNGDKVPVIRCASVLLRNTWPTRKSINRHVGLHVSFEFFGVHRSWPSGLYYRMALLLSSPLSALVLLTTWVVSLRFPMFGLSDEGCGFARRLASVVCFGSCACRPPVWRSSPIRKLYPPPAFTLVFRRYVTACFSTLVSRNLFIVFSIAVLVGCSSSKLPWYQHVFCIVFHFVLVGFFGFNNIVLP